MDIHKSTNLFRNGGIKMKAEQLKKVVENHRKFIDINSRTELEEMIYIVEDLLEEEIKYLQEHESELNSKLSEYNILKGKMKMQKKLHFCAVP